MNFTCNQTMMDREYGFYIDEGESKRSEPLMKIFCTSKFYIVFLASYPKIVVSKYSPLSTVC
jgi:hypothetical protein